MPGRKVQNHPSICPSSLLDKHSCQQGPPCCSAQSSSTHIAYKPQMGYIWIKHCPFRGLEGLLALFWMVGLAPCPQQWGKAITTFNSQDSGSRKSLKKKKIKEFFHFPLPLQSSNDFILPSFHGWYPIKDLRSLKPTPKHSLPLQRYPLLAVPVSFLHGAAPHMCLETDYSLGWLKINCMVPIRNGEKPASCLKKNV